MSREEHAFVKEHAFVVSFKFYATPGGNPWVVLLLLTLSVHLAHCFCLNNPRPTLENALEEGGSTPTSLFLLLPPSSRTFAKVERGFIQAKTVNGVLLLLLAVVVSLVLILGFMVWTL